MSATANPSAMNNRKTQKTAPWMLVGLAVSTAALSACGGESLSFHTYEVGDIDYGDAQHIVLTDGFGPSADLRTYRSQAANKLVDHGYFTASDASAGRAVVVRGDDGHYALSTGADLIPETLALEIDIIEQYAHDDLVVDVQRDPSTGAEYEVLLPIRRAVVTLEAYLVADDGFAYLEAFSVEAAEETDDPYADDDALIAAAAERALDVIVAKVVPLRRRHSVPLDASDESQQAMIDIAQGGDLERAREMADAVLAKDPAHQAALYNKAVFTDAQGHFTEALALYDAAIALGTTETNDFYTDARNACFTRQHTTLAMAD